MVAIGMIPLSEATPSGLGDPAEPVVEAVEALASGLACRY